MNPEAILKAEQVWNSFKNTPAIELLSNYAFDESIQEIKFHYSANWISEIFYHHYLEKLQDLANYLEIKSRDYNELHQMYIIPYVKRNTQVLFMKDSSTMSMVPRQAVSVGQLDTTSLRNSIYKVVSTGTRISSNKNLFQKHKFFTHIRKQINQAHEVF